LAKGFVSVYWAQAGLECLAADADPIFGDRRQENYWGPLAFVVAHAAAGAIAAIVVLSRAKGKRT
jgi:hypothetical protein